VFDIDFGAGFFYRGSTFERKYTKTLNIDNYIVESFKKAYELE